MAGKPRIDGEPETERLMLRLRPSVRQAFEAAAAVRGLPLGTWIKDVSTAAAVRELARSRRQVVATKEPPT